MISQIEGERVPQAMLPDSWIDAFILANKTAPQDIFLERVLVGDRVLKSIVSGDIDLHRFKALLPSNSQAEKLATVIDEIHALFGLDFRLQPQVLVSIWDRTYRHVKNNLLRLGEINPEKIAALSNLYSAAVEGISNTQAQLSAAQYRGSLNLDTEDGPSRFDETLLKGLHDSMYESVCVLISQSGNSEIDQDIIHSFRV